MDWKQFLKTWHGTRAENQIARWTLPGISVALALLALHVATSKPPVVLAPPQPLDGEATIESGHATANYQQAWGYHVAMLLGNVHPGNSKATKEMLDLVLTSATAPEVRDQIHEQLELLQDKGATVRFDPETVDFRPDSQTVVVTGEQTLTLRGETDGKHEKRTYEVRIGIERYRPQLLTIRTYKGLPENPEKEKS